MSADRFATLTQRQWEVLRLIADGTKDDDIALRLGIGEWAVHRHARRIYAKLGAKNRTNAAFLLGWHLRGKKA